MGILPPSGATSVQYADYEVAYHIKKDQNQEYLSYHVQLNKLLRLNLTLQDMYFSSKSFCYKGDVCFLGHVHVQTNFGGNGKVCDRYCGTHASVAIHPQSGTVHVDVRNTAYVVVRVKMFYSIIDSERISTSVGKLMCGQVNEPVWIASFQLFNLSVQIHHIRVAHYRYIVLMTNSEVQRSKIKIYDGPGTSSQPIAATSKFVSSSFQIIAHSHVLRFVDVSHNYTSQDQSLVQRFFAPSASNFVSLELCSGLFCFVQLHTNLDLRLNVSLSHFLYDGAKNTEDCDYAGIALYDLNYQGKYDVRHLSCVKETIEKHYQAACELQKGGSLYPYHNPYFFNMTTTKYIFPGVGDTQLIYSDSNILLLILYSYQEYGVMYLNVSVSAIKCSTVKLQFVEREYNMNTFRGLFDGGYKFHHAQNCLIIQILNQKMGVQWPKPYSFQLDPVNTTAVYTISITGQLGGKMFCFTKSGKTFFTSQPVLRCWEEIQFGGNFSRNHSEDRTSEDSVRSENSYSVIFFVSRLPHFC